MALEANLLEVYRQRITQETIKTWDSFQRRGRTDRLPHIAQVLPLLARLDRKPDTESLPEWLARHSTPFPPAAFSKTADRITVTVIDRWYQDSRKQPPAADRSLLAAMRHVASVGDCYRQTPLIRYFEGRLAQDRERKVTATAIACVIEHVAAPQDFLPLLLQGLEASSRRVRFHTLLALLHLAPLLEQRPGIIAKICTEMNLLWSTTAHRQEALRQYPIHAVEHWAKCEELLGNSVNDFAWTVSAVVLGQIGQAARHPSVIKTLEAGLGSDLVVPQRVAAETLLKIGAAREMVDGLLEATMANRIPPGSLRKLGALGAVLPSDRRIREALLSATIHRDLSTRAEAIESLLPFSQAPADIRLPYVQRLKAMASEANWLLTPLFGSVLETFHKQVSRQEYASTFQTFGNVSRQHWLTELAFSEIARSDMSDCVIDILHADVEQKAPAYLRIPRSLADTRKPKLPAALSPVSILYIESPEVIQRNAEITQQELQIIWSKLLEGKSYRKAAANLEMFRWEDGIVLLSFQTAEPLFLCAIELSQALRLRVRMGLHRHTNLALQCDQERVWRVAGEGLEETRSFTEKGKTGHILLSEQMRSHLPITLTQDVYPYSKFTSAKQFLQVFLLYSGPQRFGAMDNPPVSQSTVSPRAPSARPTGRKVALSFLVILLLLGAIGGATWYLLLPSGFWKDKIPWNRGASRSVSTPSTGSHGGASHSGKSKNSASTKPVADPSSQPSQEDKNQGTSDPTPPEPEPKGGETPPPKEEAQASDPWQGTVMVRSRNKETGAWTSWKPLAGSITFSEETQPEDAYPLQIRFKGNKKAVARIESDAMKNLELQNRSVENGWAIWDFEGYGSRIIVRIYGVSEEASDDIEANAEREPDFTQAYTLH